MKRVVFQKKIQRRLKNIDLKFEKKGSNLVIKFNGGHISLHKTKIGNDMIEEIVEKIRGDIDDASRKI